MLALSASGGLFFLGWTYALSAEYAGAADITVPRNRREDGYFFRPEQVAMGRSASLDKMTKYLNGLGYADAADGGPGTYRVTGGTIEIRSSRPLASPDLSITITRGRITALLAGGKAVEDSELPAQRILSFSTFQDPAARHGTLPVRQTPISADAVPDLMKHAITSAEDRRYFETKDIPAHHGCSPFNVFRRVVTSGGLEGGSGLAQQALKLEAFRGSGDQFWDRLFPMVSKDVRRKLVDCQLALALEKQFGKEKVFAFYANAVPLGPSNGVDLIGIEAASQEYLGAAVSELELHQAATIAAMIRKPPAFLRYVRNGSRCVPEEIERKTCRDLTARRNWVLDRMQEDRPELYTSEIVEHAKKQPIEFVFASEKIGERPVEMLSRNFVRYAAKNRPVEIVEANALPGETDITTTLDAEMQEAGFAIAERAARKLQGKVDSACKRQAPLCSVASPNMDAGEGKPQVALVALEPATGEILTMVGGLNSSLNYAADVVRDPGSCHKPFYAVQAIEAGFWHGKPVTAATIWDPQNDVLSGRCAAENMGSRAGLREALAQSYNFHACALSESVGMPTRFVGEVTGSSPVRQLASAIGETGEGTLLDLAAAYGIFPNNGRFVPPTPYRAIHKDGTLIDLKRPASRQVSDHGAAWIVANILRSVIGPNGTAPDFLQQAELQAIKYNIGAKSGTGQLADLTFVAFTPRIVVAVRVSMPKNRPRLEMRQGFSGSSVAAPIVAAFFKYLKQNRPEYLGGTIERPINVVERFIDRKLGCRVESGGTPEFFLVGREPELCSGIADTGGQK